MNTTVKFCWHQYGNLQDNYYVDNYEALKSYLGENFVFSSKVNLGITDGVVIVNTFKGNFHSVNCALVEHDDMGTHIYKITKKVFIRRNMWRVTLIKDVVSARYQDIVKSDVLVGRIGIDRTQYDPILLIEEEMKLNQVKVEQHLLGEIPNHPSYGYLAIWKKDSIDGTIVWDATAINSGSYDFTVAGIDTLPYYNTVVAIKQFGELRVSWTIPNEEEPSKAPIYGTVFNTVNGVIKDNKILDLGTGYFPNLYYYKCPFSSPISELLPTPTQTLINDYQYTTTLVTNTASLDGKVVYDTVNNKMFELKVEFVAVNEKTRTITPEEMKSITGYNDVTLNLSFPRGVNLLKVREETIRVTFTELPNLVITDQNLGEMDNMIDQPLQAFFVPVPKGFTYIIYDGEPIYVDEILIEKMMYDLMAKYSGDNGKLIDVQIIPYSPISGLYNESGYITISNGMHLGADATKVITIGDNTILLYEVPYASYQLEVNWEKGEYGWRTNTIDVDDYKIDAKRKYLLTSPSGSSNYELSVTKNKGFSGAMVYVDIRPYASFHRLVPFYDGLYGRNFNDTRGLIWIEDTSLTQTSSAWETYKRQNINYLNSFNADIDFRRSQQSIQHEANWGNFGFDASKRIIEAGVEAAVAIADSADMAILSGGASIAGGLTAAGAIMGGAIAMEGIEAGQLAYNNKMENKLLSNEISYAKNQFNMSLDNVRALPENVEKVSGVYNTNNYVPYMQIFEPTEEEIKWYTRYLDLNGVNVGTIINLQEYVFDYLQGVVVKFNGIITNEEYLELYNQLMRGVRKYKEEE